MQLVVSGSDSECENLAKALPSSNSKDYGKSFSEIFKSVHMTFIISIQCFLPPK